MEKKRRKRWAFKVGDRGRTRVRAFEHRPRVYFIEWRANGKRRRLAVHPPSQANAKRAARDKSAELQLSISQAARHTLGHLLHEYHAAHDARWAVSHREHQAKFRRFWLEQTYRQVSDKLRLSVVERMERARSGATEETPTAKTAATDTS